MSKHGFSEVSDNKEHLKTLIKWLIEEVQSAGGDGDGIWHSQYYSIDQLKALIIEEKLMSKHWQLEMCNPDGFWMFGNQECLLITNSKEDFDNRPSWQQVSLVY
jgi:hypothetical protein